MSVLADSKVSSTTSAPECTLPTRSLRRFSSSKSLPNARELSCPTSCCGSEQNLDTNGGKNAYSPDYSFDSGIGASSELDLRRLIKLVNKTVVKETNKSSGSETAETAAGFSRDPITAVGIGTGISCSVEEQMRQKMRYERLQQWRLILYSLDRQKHPYRQLRERLSKICEGRGTKKESTKDHICNVCSCQMDRNDSKNHVTCYVCSKRVCRAAKCSNWLPGSDRWECQLCHLSKDSLSHTQTWVAEQMSINRQKRVNPNSVRARSEIFIPIGDYNENSMQFESVSQVGLNSTAITSEQKLKIREYVEEVVAKLLGGSLDQIRVSQLSKSENYLPGIINSHAATSQSFARQNENQSHENGPPEISEVSQTRLRQMIELIIAETLRSPEVALNTFASGNEIADVVSRRNRNAQGRRSSSTERYFEPRIYQDLLATAVLNKIADKEGNFRQFSESTPDLSLSNINANFDVQDRSISSTSSAEPRSDFSYTDTEQSPKISKVSDRESILNEYIASHTVPLPDFSTAVTESEEDDHDSISSNMMADGNWEDNWLFKKKSSSLTTSMTGSVGMLVPAPKDDVRAQIGDKTTDEISDLSEMGSDTDDSSAKLDTNLNPLNDRILNKHLIGGQNTGVILDELMETASLISITSPSQDEPKFTEATNECVTNVSPEYESDDTKAGAKNDNPKVEPVCDSLSGSIAEREHKKWNNAVEMPNNPYTTEALQRRISGSQDRFIDLPNISGSTGKNPIALVANEAEAGAESEIRSDIDYKRYSRDYYINDENVAKTSPNHQIVTRDARNCDKLPADDSKIEQTTIVRKGIQCIDDSPPPSPKTNKCKVSCPKELPVETNMVATRVPIAASKGSTPRAFKFLQPKRRLIDPSQILSLDEEACEVPESPPGERTVVEEEVAQIMPSVKALAQAFLSTSYKCTPAEKRWKKGIKVIPSTPVEPKIKLESMRNEASLSLPEVGEDATIASDLSSLETDPPAIPDLAKATPIIRSSPERPSNTDSSKSSSTHMLRRVSMLKSNIAFFENLKFK